MKFLSKGVQVLVVITSVLIMSIFMVSCAEKLVTGDNNPDPDPVIPDAELILFWMFDGAITNNTELSEVYPGHDPAQLEARIAFISSLSDYPFTNRSGSMERRNRPTDVNYFPEGNGGVSYEQAEPDMRAIQIRQPFEGDAGVHQLIFEIPTTGHRFPVLSFAAMDENAADGFIFDYSTSEGNPQWTQENIPENQRQQPLMTEAYQRYVVDLSNVEAANDNPNLKVRVRFLVSDPTVDNGDRVTFNNVALKAVPGL